MFERFDELEKRTVELEKMMADPELIREQHRYSKVVREHGGLAKIVAAYRKYKELKRVEDLLHELLARHTGQTAEQIAADFDRDRFMTAEEAI